MDGIVYLLNQTGLALAQAEKQIESLSKRVSELEEELGKKGDKSSAS